MLTQTSASTDLLMLVNQYLIHIEKVERLAIATVKNRKYILGAFARDTEFTDVRNITPYDIDEYFITHCAADKPSSLNTRKRCFRLFFQYCQEYREINIAFNWDVIRLRKDKPPRVISFTAETVAAVIDTCTVLQDKLIIATMFETGMRIGEILTFKVENIYGTEIQVRGKGQVDRLVYMSKDLAKQMRSFLKQEQRFAGYVFRPLQKQRNHPEQGYISAYAVRDRIEAAFKRHGIKMHPHQLRHSFAVEWVRSGGDIRTLQVLLGHENMETTERYLQFSDTQMQENYDRVFTSSVIGVNVGV